MNMKAGQAATPPSVAAFTQTAAPKGDPKLDKIESMLAKMLTAVAQAVQTQLSQGGPGPAGQPGAAQQTPRGPAAAEQQAPPEAAADAGAGAKAEGPSVADKRAETVSVLGRHEDVFRKDDDDHSMSLDDIIKRAEEEGKPPDVIKALHDLKKDSALTNKLDSQGGAADGKFNSDELNKLQESSEFKSHTNKKSETYTHNYVPSDGDPKAPPREMTANDAKRELFRYSDNLGSDVSIKELKEVADGSRPMDKCPPQVQAAAKYFADNPKEFAKLTDDGKPGSAVSKEHFLQKCSDTIQYTPAEQKTIDTISKNKDEFFGDESLTPERAQEIADDESKKPEVRQAAADLAKNPMLFSMMDNGKHGYSGTALYKADDKKISGDDFDNFQEKRSKETARQGPAAKPADRDAAASRDMNHGQMDQPEERKSDGGQLKDVARHSLKAYSVMQSALSTATGVVAGLNIPVFSQVAGIASIASSAASHGAKVGVTALDGGNVEESAKKEAAGFGIDAVTTFIPGGRVAGAGAKVGLAVGKEGAEAAAKQGAKEGAEAAAKQGAKEGAEAAGKQGGKEATDSAGKQAAQEGAEGAGKQTSWWKRDANAEVLKNDKTGARYTNGDVVTKSLTKAGTDIAKNVGLLAANDQYKENQSTIDPKLAGVLQDVLGADAYKRLEEEGIVPSENPTQSSV
jgi:type III secretion translocon protein HrpF